MKYLVKNRKTGEETLCEKVVVNGFDYYIVNKLPNAKDYFITRNNGLGQHNGADIILFKDDRKVIATTNKSLDIPIVIDELNISQYSREEHKKNHPLVQEMSFALGIMVGYDKAKETYNYTKEDMVEFAIWGYFKNPSYTKTTEELFDIWQQQRIIKIEVE